MKLGRKILAILMAAMMLISMLPASAEIVDGADSCYHEWAWSWPDGKPANCQDWKMSQEYCKLCGVTGSSFEQCGPCEPGSKQWITDKPGNCMEYGVWEITCKHCGEWLDGAEEPGSHNWATNVLEQPTCTEDGWKETLCTVCGSEKDAPEEIPATGHSFGEWKTEVVATCIQEGVTSRSCKTCGYKEYMDSDYGSHNWSDWKLVERGDCEHPGLEERNCSLCGESQHRETEGNDHSWGAWETVKEPSCAEEGRKERECRRCGEDQSRSIEKLDHSFGPWTIIQEPTAEDPGIRERVCGVCGYAEREEFYPEGTLKKGDRGDLVEKLQEALNEEGYDCGTADGIFGNKTENAVKEYQEDNYMVVDGVAWPELINGLLDYVRFEKYVDSDPANGDFYVPGEVIEYILLVTNACDVPLIEIEITDPLKGNNEDAIIAIAESLEPGERKEYSFSYTVTEEDAAHDLVVNQADLRFMDSSIDTMLEIKSNVVETIVGEGELPDPADDPIEEPTDEPTDEPSDAPDGTITEVVPVNPDSPWENIINNPNWSIFNPVDPEDDPTDDPAGDSNDDPADDPTDDPNGNLNGEPTDEPTDNPTGEPTDEPTGDPDGDPTGEPADDPTGDPDGDPTGEPTDDPTGDPADDPTDDPTDIPAGDPGEDPFIPGSTTVLFDKSVESAPGNGSYYQEGEIIFYMLRVENLMENEIVDVELWDPLKGGNEDACVDRIPVLGTGEAYYTGFGYTVSADDVARGYVYNQALLCYSDPVGDAYMEIYSNEIIVPTSSEMPDAPTEDPNGDPGDGPIDDDPFGVETEDPSGSPEDPSSKPEDPFGVETEDPDDEKSGVSIVKSVQSTPANGAYYLPGETVTFAIEVINPGKPAKTGITVSDPLMAENGGVWTMDYLENYATTGFVFDYTVTEANALAGSVTNIATVQCWDEDGERYAAVSEPVTVPCGFEEGNLPPFGVITDLSIVKEEISTPANGLYYTEGETISYRIVYTNTGETEIGVVKVYDTLRGVGVGKAVGVAGSLASGASAECFFNYDVTAGDVAHGYVANAAIAEYEIGGGYTGTATSNTVISDTDGKPDDGTGKIDLSKLGGEGICCTRTLTSRSNASAEYEVRFCEKHAAVMAAAQKMASVAGSEAAKAKAYEFAATLWQDEINAMYDELLEACDEIAKITVLSERSRFQAMVANNYFALKAQYPNSSVAEAAAVQVWKDKCINLCNEIHTAPEKRTDSLIRVAIGEGKPAADAFCSCEVAVDDGKTIVYADMYCTSHAIAFDMMQALLEADAGAETWEMIRTLWDIELLSAFESLNAGAEEERGMAFMAEYAAYTSWIEAREAILQLFYPENPEITAEVMAETVMGRTLDLCAMAK